jgi:hypothetical protein
MNQVIVFGKEAIITFTTCTWIFALMVLVIDFKELSLFKLHHTHEMRLNNNFMVFTIRPKLSCLLNICVYFLHLSWNQKLTNQN